jgi:beta-mannanase
VLLKQAPVVSLSIVLFPESEGRAHARCAAGAFDTYFQGFGSQLVKLGAGNAIIRLGHEANANPAYTDRNWLITDVDGIGSYIGCFQNLSKALKSTAPDVKIEWTMAKKGFLPVSVMQAYPGDDYVDYIGITSYDNGPKYTSELIWTKTYMKTRLTGPLGYGAWLKVAREHGKKLAVSEWGVWERDGLGYAESDNDFYIQKVYDFFKANAADIAYETYYNCPDRHRLFPNSFMPKASAKYQQLWSTNQ